MALEYRCGLTDSTRWAAFTHRPGDIVVSTPSKCGTTWAQMICALLVFGTPDLPAPLTSLSPWLDMRLRPVEEVCRALDAQSHRRFVKTHTPLDGLPLREDVTYVVVGRDPRDVAVSLHHHRANLNLEVVDPASVAPAAPVGVGDGTRRFLFAGETPQESLSSLRGTAWHLRGAWDLRTRPNVVLLHYADLVADLPAAMTLLADRLGLPAPTPALVAAATFDRMRERAPDLVPDERMGLLTDSARFFRRAGVGGWRDVLTDDDLARYEALIASLAPPDFRRWLHEGAA